MSNILRRPMFRGGRVDSRGMGITSNLGYNKGGRVGYQKGSLIGQYGTAGANDRTALTGANILDLASRRLTNIGGSNLANNFVLKDFANQYGIGGFDQGTSKAPGIFGKSFFAQDEEFTVGDGDNKVSFTLNDLLEDARKYDREQIERSKGIGTGSGEQDIGGLGTMTVVSPEQLETNEKGITYLDIQKGTKPTVMDNMKTIVDSSDSDPITVGEDELQSMISRYEDLLGGKQARQRDIGDMLGRISVSALKRPERGEERNIGDILGDFMTAEVAAGPGRAEKIKQAASMLGIKGEQARELYKIKSRSEEGAFTKQVNEIMSSQNISRSQAVRMALGSPGTIGEAVIKYKNTAGMPPSPTEFDFLAEGYTSGPLPADYKTSKPTGTFYIPGEMVIVKMTGGNEESTKSYKNQ
jgi:hypothetical protein